jgi:hypothetical protein
MAFLVVRAIDTWLDRKFTCDCGRERPWYFTVYHPRGGVFLGRAIWNTMLIVLCVLIAARVGGVITAMLAIWTWRAWWFHEKDKLKKKAAKALGVVSFNKHGKIVVANNK